MATGIWSPSQDVTTQQDQEKPTLLESQAAQEFLKRTISSEERAFILGELVTLQERMNALQESDAATEMPSIESQLEQIAIEGKDADRELASLESHTLALRNADLQREATLVKCNRELNNLRAGAPDRFATRRDVANHDARIKDAERLAAEAEKDVRIHSQDLQQHLDTVEQAKQRVRDLLAKEHSLKTRLAFLQGKPAPGNVSNRPTSYSSNGLGGGR